ncbi:MAG: hypothetical protein Q9162_006409 [Coniocarpon cinnabarinum]
MASNQVAPTLDHPIIRQATPNDIPHILQLIRDLAEFEHALDRVEATEESLRKTIDFAPDKGHPNPNPEGLSTTRIAGCLVVEAPPSGPPKSHQGAAKHQTQPAPAAADQHRVEVVGIAIYYHTYSTWLAVTGIHLEDLYIAPSHRKRGYATLLFAQLAKLVEQVSGGRGRLQWDCLRWNTNALDFYKGETIGGKSLDEWIAIRLEGKDQLRRLAERVEN